MKAEDYVKALDAVYSIERNSYQSFNTLWRKLWDVKDTSRTLTDEEFEMMQYLIETMQDIACVKKILEQMDEKEGEKE